jgi:chemotaxis protein methyltransferase CheR
MEPPAGPTPRGSRHSGAPSPSPFEPPPLTDKDLAAVISLVYRKSGITLHEGKRALVTARLQKRLRATGARTFSDYLKLVDRDKSGDELVELLDAIATNHTSFFRESEHFAFLKARVVPEWLGQNGAASHEPLHIWSAACSSGEEPYTLAVSLLQTLPERDHTRFRILASDLSTKALRAAEAGVYRIEKVRDLPIEVLRAYFEKGLGDQDGWARVQPQVKRQVDFRQINLLETGHVGRTFAAIFCRNVMIYFDRPAQQRVVANLEQHLKPGGYLFISHSESLNGITHGLRWVAPAVYQRRLS